jgi:hypothetical protein
MTAFIVPKDPPPDWPEPCHIRLGKTKKAFEGYMPHQVKDVIEIAACIVDDHQQEWSNMIATAIRELKERVK